MLSHGDVDGFGFYGILDEDEHGQLLCHICGDRFGHLGLHAYKAHGILAADYKRSHGLLRSRGLVSTLLREQMRQTAADRYDPTDALATSRDPAVATQARLARSMGASAEEVAGRDERMSQVGRSARIGRVTTCGFCSVQFCALSGSLKRLYCSRRCAGKAIRAAEKQPRNSG